MDFTSEQVKIDIKSFVPMMMDEWLSNYQDICADLDSGEEPEYTLTFSTNDNEDHWGYQSGDNSFTGGAYGLPHWAVIYFNEDLKTDELIEDIFSQWADLINN
jgi:hypothetical protein